MFDPVGRLNAALEGRYRIERELGVGGMATVYLAGDIHHGRKVALKVLRPELAAAVGAERFLEEIRTTAHLQHPNLLPLFDSGEADGLLFYLMPFVEGESLRHRIEREGQLPVDEAVRLAGDIAEGLDYAHRHGVIHRDIKPENILLHDGRPMVADFGIALAVGAADERRLTEAGLTPGTPHYMSPEQATGDQTIGAATDIWALGCVLFEMLVGEPPHTGRTSQAILGKIILAQPGRVRALRRSVPPNVEAALERALEKVPADRFVTARDFAEALADEGFRNSTSATRSRSPRLRGWAVTVWAATVGVSFALGVWATLSRQSDSAPVTRTVLSTRGLPSMEAPFGLLAAVRSDGSALVLPVGSGSNHQLGLKLRGSMEIVPILGTDGARSVAFSPDGLSIVYTVGRDLFRRRLAGGEPVRLAQDADMVAEGIAWLSDRTILYEQMIGGAGFLSRIARIPEDGGVPLQIVESSEAGAGFPIWMYPLPDARGALVVSCGGIGTCTAETSHLYALDLERGSLEHLLDEVTRAWYVSPHEQIVVVRPDGTVSGIPFDVRRLELRGSPVPLLDGVRVGAVQADMLLGDDGTVLYVAGQPSAYGLRELVWVDRTGRDEPIDPGLPPRGFTSLALSPDGQRLAVSIETVQASEIWVKDLPDGPLVRLTEHAGATRWPTWTHDQSAVAYISNDGGTPHVRRVRADGGSRASFDVVLRRDLPVMEALFSRRAGAMVFREGQPPYSEARIGLLAFGTPNVVHEALPTGMNESGLALSPDGEWLAFVSNLTGRDDVFVRRISDPSGRTPVSTNGGVNPVWARRGPEMFYREPASGAMFVATYVSEPSFRIQSRQQLFDAGGFSGGVLNHGGYDVAANDQRFVMMRPALGDARLVLVENWFGEVRDRLGR